MNVEIFARRRAGRFLGRAEGAKACCARTRPRLEVAGRSPQACADRVCRLAPARGIGGKARDLGRARPPEVERHRRLALRPAPQQRSPDRRALALARERAPAGAGEALPAGARTADRRRSRRPRSAGSRSAADRARRSPSARRRGWRALPWPRALRGCGPAIRPLPPLSGNGPPLSVNEGSATVPAAISASTSAISGLACSSARDQGMLAAAHEPRAGDRPAQKVACSRRCRATDRGRPAAARY